MSRVLSRLRIVGPAALAGLGLAASIPPWGFWVLAFPSAALLWWRLGGLPLRSRLLAGYVAGLGLYVPGLWWAVPFNVYGGIIMMLLLCIGPALACAAAPPGRGRTPALAGTMVLLEVLRDTWPFGGMPLGGVVLGQVAGPLAGTARIGGQFLLLGLVWVVGGGLGALAQATVREVQRSRAMRHDPAGWRPLAEHAVEAGQAAEARVPGDIVRPPSPGIAGGLVAGLVSILAVAAVAGAATAAPGGGPARGVVQASAVQGGGVRGLHKSQVDPATVLAAQFAASAALFTPGASGGSGGNPRAPAHLVLWPEDVVALDGPLAGSSTEQALGNLAQGLHATLLVGVTEPAPGRHFLNELVAFGPDGTVVDRYEKVHRVPFGEYVPARGIFEHFADLSGVPLDAIPGHGDGVLHTPAATVGAMVSYEVFFPARARTPVRNGAQLLVVPTNTSSYATTQVPTQELAASRLRAIEEGRDLVQAAPAGYSAVIDNHGRVHALSVLGRRQVLVRPVALRSGWTIYAHVGDLLAIALAVAGVAGGWMASLTEVDERTAAGRRERAATADRATERVRSRS